VGVADEHVRLAFALAKQALHHLFAEATQASTSV
jgi:hypothetical protein